MRSTPELIPRKARALTDLLDIAGAARAVYDLAYNPSQPRDEDGKWTDGVPGPAGLAPGAKPRHYQEFQGGPSGAWGKLETMKWRKRGLTPNDEEVLQNYTSSGYMNVNTALRDAKGKESALPEYARADVEALDRAMRDAQVTRDLVAHRVLDDPDMWSRWKAEGGLEGDEFVDDAFTSTTLDRGVTDRFLGMLDNPIHATINIPEGTSGAYLGEIGSNPKEHELLLDRGTVFEVTDAWESEGSWGPILNVQLQVVKQR